MPDDISSLSPVRRILRRNNTIVLLHRLREVRKRNRESIKRSRQRIRESPQVRRSTRFEEKKAETPGFAGPSNLGTDHESRPNEKIGELSKIGIKPFKELVTVWSKADPLKRPKSLTIVGMDQITETGRVCDDQRGASFNSKRHSKPIVKDIIFQEQNRDVLLDLTPFRLPQVPEQDIIVTNTNDDVTFARSHLDVEAITPVLDMEEEARRKVAQYSNPFLQDLYRKERILLMARIMAKVEKVSKYVHIRTFRSFLTYLQVGYN